MTRRTHTPATMPSKRAVRRALAQLPQPLRVIAQGKIVLDHPIQHWTDPRTRIAYGFADVAGSYRVRVRVTQDVDFPGTQLLTVEAPEGDYTAELKAQRTRWTFEELDEIGRIMEIRRLSR